MDYKNYEKVITKLVVLISKEDKTRERSLAITKLEEAVLWLREDKLRHSQDDDQDAGEA